MLVRLKLETEMETEKVKVPRHCPPFVLPPHVAPNLASINLGRRSPAEILQGFKFPVMNGSTNTLNSNFPFMHSALQA